MSLIEIIRGFKEGDKQCFAYLFKKYGAELENFITRSGFDKFDTSKILQATFLQAWKAREVFTIPEDIDETELGTNFKKWLYWICNKQILTARKRKPHLIVISLDNPNFRDRDIEKEMVEGELENQPLAYTVHNDLQDRKKIQLNNFLKRLPHQDRSLLLLRFCEEFTYEEIAYVFQDINPATIRKRTQRAQKKLQDIIITDILDEYCQSLRTAKILSMNDLKDLFPVIDGNHQALKNALEFEKKWFSAYSNRKIVISFTSVSTNSASAKATQHFLHLKTYAQIAGDTKNAHLVRRKIYNFLEKEVIIGNNKQDKHEPE